MLWAEIHLDSNNPLAFLFMLIIKYFSKIL